MPSSANLGPLPSEGRDPANVSAMTDRPVATGSDSNDGGRELRASIAPYRVPESGRSVGQLFTSVGLFVVGCAVMYAAVQVSWLLTLALALPTGALLVRVFIVQHDCGHGGFFVSRRLNDWIGRLCSALTMTPYHHWRRQHARHHGSWNNLDRRSSGADMYSDCLTVDEYLALGRWRRFLYRAVRHPVVAHLLIPPLVFVLLYRFPFDTPATWKRERRSVHLTNLALVALFAALIWVFGPVQVLLVHLPIMIVASIIGVWLFSLQHRFEHAVWARDGKWELSSAALEGSSYLRLPRVLQWFTGSIGLHHIHHLDPRVPNYKLQDCYDGVAGVRSVKPITLRGGLRAIRLTLWDEERGRLIRFADVAQLRAA